MSISLRLFLILILLNQQKGNAQVLDTLVNLGSHKLHVKILKGAGTPILFEAGNGDDGSVWEALLAEIHKATGATLITYDRAGLGKSEIDTTNISFKGEIQDITTALQKLGYREDFFLVAHSFGGFYASEFARRNKGKIAGAVFLDVATPCGLSVERASSIKDFISAENWKLIKEYKVGLYYVLQKFPEIAAYMSKRYIPDSIPLTVIAAEIRTPTKGIGETEKDMLHMTNCLKALGNSPNHTYVLARGSEHKVWEKRPELVIEEIVSLYKQTAK
ncbi:MAG: alpha/beta hydrolase [Bacteroidota bacterium]